MTRRWLGPGRLMPTSGWHLRSGTLACYNAYASGQLEKLDPEFMFFQSNVHRFLLADIKPTFLKQKVDEDLRTLYKMVTSRYESTAEDLSKVKTMVTYWQSYRIHTKFGRDAAKKWLNAFVKTRTEPLAWRKADAMAGWTKKTAATMDEAEKEVIRGKLLDPPADLFPVSVDSPVVQDNSLDFDVSALSPEMEMDPPGPVDKTGGDKSGDGKSKKDPPAGGRRNHKGGNKGGGNPDPKPPVKGAKKPGGKY